MKTLHSKPKHRTRLRPLMVPSFLATIILINATSGHAAPVAWPRGGASQEGIINKTNSSLLADSEDKALAWVLPPSSGVARQFNFRGASANLGFCQELASLQTYSRQISDQLGRYRSQALDLEERSSALETRYNLLQDEAAKLAGDPSRSVEYTQAVARAQNAKAAWDDSYRTFEKVNERILAGKSTIMALHSDLAKFEGGFSEVDYDTGWDGNIQTLQDSNPGRKFAKIPTEHARILAQFPGGADRDSYLASLPQVISYSIAGKNYLPYGDAKDAEVGALPTRFPAILRLNLLGACPIVHPEQFSVSKDVTGAPLIGISATYEYPVLFRASMKFSYNLYRVYEWVKKQSKKGGFFSSKTKTTTSESTFSDEHFKAEWYSEDAANETPADLKRAIEEKMRKELVERVLLAMGTPVTDKPEAIAPGTTGADVIANGLDKTCGEDSVSCKAGAWLIRGASATFGSSSSEQRFKQVHDIRASIDLREEVARFKPGFTGFTRE